MLLATKSTATLKITLDGKNDFAKISKNLARYKSDRSEKSFVRPSK